jgi:hypothetical protein
MARAMRNSCTRRAKFRMEKICIAVDEGALVARMFLKFCNHDKPFQTTALDAPAGERGIGGAVWLVGKP